MVDGLTFNYYKIYIITLLRSESLLPYLFKSFTVLLKIDHEMTLFVFVNNIDA